MPSLRCPYDIAFNSKGKIQPLRCGKWTCQTCSKHLAREWSMRVWLEVEKSGGRAYFITLTLRPDVTTARQGYGLLPRLWDNLRKSFSRGLGGQKWMYCAFVEAHPKREKIPHFHIISINRPANKVKERIWRAGFGYEYKCTAIVSKKAAHYVAKYSSKQDDEMPRGFRRVRTSQGWAKLPETGHDAYLVRSKSELIQDYLVRVANATERDLVSLTADYLSACEQMREKWSATPPPKQGVDKHRTNP